MTSLSSSKRREIVYDSILIIIDKYIKIIKYIFVIKIIDIAQLTKTFFEKIVLRFNISNDIVSDREFVFTSVFWFAICFYARIRRRLNITFYSQSDEQIERQNQILEHYLRIYANNKQTNWANLLSLAEFAYNNNHYSFADSTSFYLMFNYYFEIRYKVENNFLKKKILFANQRIKQLQTLRNDLIDRLNKINVY